MGIALVVGALSTVRVSDDWKTRISWPSGSRAAVGLQGDIVTSGPAPDAPLQSASLTKLITALVVLAHDPIGPTDTGWIYPIEAADIARSHALADQGLQTAPVVEGAPLSQREALEMMLVGSAADYTEMLVTRTFGSVDAFLGATETWLAQHDLTDTHVVDPVGMDAANTTTVSDILRIARIAHEHPVVSEIAGTKVATAVDGSPIPNTNPLLGVDGVDGLKTGSLDGAYSLIVTAPVHGHDAFVLVWDAASSAQREADAVRVLASLRAALE
ncbi:hypothetical protein AB1K54_01835 [Microbacterium sp. BWT-B31]|uniref:D-alanyl-D-alanine carboxypeptidase family protein n=1 Tax=Microbacterium sp. BWT-B31 TaxID=3232072 RepID=UPI003527041B